MPATESAVEIAGVAPQALPVAWGHHRTLLCPPGSSDRIHEPFKQAHLAPKTSYTDIHCAGSCRIIRVARMRVNARNARFILLTDCKGGVAHGSAGGNNKTDMIAASDGVGSFHSRSLHAAK
jgi:hypothetical protein